MHRTCDSQENVHKYKYLKGVSLNQFLLSSRVKIFILDAKTLFLEARKTFFFLFEFSSYFIKSSFATIILHKWYIEKQLSIQITHCGLSVILQIFWVWIKVLCILLNMRVHGEREVILNLKNDIFGKIYIPILSS